ncbi:MAG TPA: 3-keto-5-aminohexanoate cleavage protein [Mycobacteriales bacterium]|nr:3-keto-5-aminohexanoate cleavage protein [Mycobacteriales bacterium]
MPSATLITVAPTGAESAKSDAPALPVTIEELVATAKACEAVGAAVVHVHVRDDAGAPTLDLGRVSAAISGLREATDCVVQVSTGGAVTDSEADRLRVLDAAPDSGSLTCGTINFGDEVFLNRWPFMEALYLAMREREIVPEFEIFDLGQIASMNRLLDRHGAPFGGHVHADLVMGVPGGMPGTLEALAACVAALPNEASWSATGVGRSTLPVALGALAAGGHLRVGMEDTLTFAPGRPVRDNAELVERAADLARLAARPPMTADDARAMLGIKDRRRTPTQTKAKA